MAQTMLHASSGPLGMFFIIHRLYFLLTNLYHRFIQRRLTMMTRESGKNGPGMLFVIHRLIGRRRGKNCPDDATRTVWAIRYAFFYS